MENGSNFKYDFGLNLKAVNSTKFKACRFT